MGSDPVLRELSPIRTSPIDANPALEDDRPPAPSSSKPSSSIEQQETAAVATEEDCVTTPRSEEHLLKPALVCPPAPRKPRPAKRKFTEAEAAPQPRGFYPVPDDLASVFVPLPRPPSKRIRVG